MEITIKIEEMNEDKLRQRFDIIKRTAYNKKPLPDDFEPDRLDLDFYEKIKRVYENYRLQIKTEDESKKKVELYFNTYKTDKAIRFLKLEAAKAVLETRKKTGQVTRQMVTLDFSRYEEAIKLLYQLFEITLDRPTAQALKPFVEYLKTGYKPQEEVTADDKHDSADGEACA